jgi:hypothetical protein
VQVVRLLHISLGSVLTLGAGGLIVGAVWIAGQPRYLCDEGIHDPNGWKYAGFALFALALPVLVFLATLMLDESRIVQRIYIAVALGEAVVALALAVYLNGKWTGNYQCG